MPLPLMPLPLMPLPLMPLPLMPLPLMPLPLMLGLLMLGLLMLGLVMVVVMAKHMAGVFVQRSMRRVGFPRLKHQLCLTPPQKTGRTKLQVLQHCKP
jgi:hypothetical protein